MSLAVTQGNSASFSVSASGDTPLSYQWYENNSAVAGATNASYTISATQPSNAGSYECGRVEQRWLGDEHGGDVDGVDTANDYATADEPGGDARQQRQLQR